MGEEEAASAGGGRRGGGCRSVLVRWVAYSRGKGLVQGVGGREFVFAADPGVEVAHKECGVAGEGGVEGYEGVVE